MHLLLRFFIFSFLLLIFIVPPSVAQNVPARGWEGTVDLPTYLLGEEDPFPPFGIVNSHHVYPYTMLDDLTDRRENKRYRAIFLENEYLKATILPDVGGRLYSLYDKLAGREVFYRNHVVKYGLVSLRGAWISGGIEFNFPNGHTVVTVSPVDSQLSQDSDGSARAIVGGVDQITGMHWEVALILRPGAARLEQQVTLFNDTPTENLFWYWANAAVPATEDMQFIYPMREVNPHSRTEIWSYPVWKGVDYSWYKQIRQPTSLFGLGIRRDFFGAYYHNSDYGVVHVADHREVPGKKVWSWGVAQDGLIWTDLLTDQDGPYNEIQSGRFETQLDREYMPPQRVESWTEFWYPVRGLSGGFVEANRDVAINVVRDGSQTKVLVYSNVDAGKVRLRVKASGKLLQEIETVPVEAGKTISYRINIPRGQENGLNIELENAQERQLLSWSADAPVDGNPDFVSKAGSQPRPKSAPDQMTVQELYLFGVEQEKEGRDEAAVKTFEGVLQRDKDNTAALLKLAWRSYRATDFKHADQLLTRALERNSTNPDLLYAAGVVCRAEGRLGSAEDHFWTAIRFGGEPGPALLQLGEISIQKKNYGEAENLLRRTLTSDPANALALSDLAMALRLSGNISEASHAADQALKWMPLLPQARAAKRSLDADDRHPSDPVLVDTQNAMEAASWLRNLGDLDTSDRVLKTAATRGSACASPLIYYYLASNAWKGRRDATAKEYAAKAVSCSMDKVFPQRISDAEVLSDVLAHNPSDGHADYLLGNFLFAHGRYEEAADSWKRAQSVGFDDAVVERNLGIYESRVHDNLKSAAEYFQKAIQLAPTQYRLYPELDEIYTRMHETSKRADLFAAAPKSVLEHDIVIVRRALLLVERRQFDTALQILSSHRFKPWEGGQIVREMFVFANLEKGKLAMQDRHYSAAEQAFRQALEYPVNLGVGKPDQPDDTEALYWLGEALSAESKSADAQAAWQSAANSSERRGSSAVYRAISLQKAGQKEEGSALLQELAQVTRTSSAQELYTAGLAERYRGNLPTARANFEKAIEKDPAFWNARLALSSP
jgi:tetratricopeptide (TPR) repeat protein